MHRLLQFTLDLFEGTPFAAPRPVVKPTKRRANPPVAPAPLPPVPQAAVPTASNAVPAPPAEPLQDVLRPTHFRHPRANRESRLGDALVAYEFKRGKRKTIGFIVGADGLVVSAPK